jgi:hypothetical protein
LEVDKGLSTFIFGKNCDSHYSFACSGVRQRNFDYFCNKKEFSILIEIKKNKKPK